MKSKLTLRQTTVADCYDLARNIRAADDLEIEGTSGRPALEVLLEGLSMSAEIRTGLVDGKVLAIFGVVGGGSLLGDRIGVVWALTSTRVERHRVLFYRASRVVIADLLTRWDVLTNMVDARYHRAIRWIERLGATVLPAETYGIEDRPFIPFEFRGSHV